MTVSSYVIASLLWAVYGLVIGFGTGSIARLMWTNSNRK